MPTSLELYHKATVNLHENRGTDVLLCTGNCCLNTQPISVAKSATYLLTCHLQRCIPGTGHAKLVFGLAPISARIALST